MAKRTVVHITLLLVFTLGLAAQITAPAPPQFNEPFNKAGYGNFSNNPANVQSPHPNINVYNRQEASKREVAEALEEDNINRAQTLRSKYRFANNASTEYQSQARDFLKAFDEIKTMLQADSLTDIKRAIYVNENAFFDKGKKLSYEAFNALVQQKVKLVKYILKKERLDTANSDAVHYAIQKLFSTNISIPQSNGTVKVYKKLSYDFNDIFGEKDLKQLFVTKLLVTGKGQCHSLPLLYMILAQEFKSPCYMAYSPEHSYIQFKNAQGTWYNYETTTGRLTSDAFILGSGFIKSEAVKNGIYTTPNNKKEVIANLLTDLAIYYLQKFGFDNFQQQCGELTLNYNPKNMTAYLIKANYYTAQTDAVLAAYGYPPPQQLQQHYPNLYR